MSARAPAIATATRAISARTTTVMPASPFAAVLKKAFMGASAWGDDGPIYVRGKSTKVREFESA